ncbi:unnamed protein product, partial [Rotaria sordida]
WFGECLCFMDNADESMYTVNLTSNQITTWHSSFLLLSSSKYDDSSLLDLPIKYDY